MKIKRFIYIYIYIYIYNVYYLVTVNKTSLIGFYVSHNRKSLKILNSSKFQQSGFSCKKLWKPIKLVHCSQVLLFAKVKCELHQNFIVWKIHIFLF